MTTYLISEGGGSFICTCQPSYFSSVSFLWKGGG